MAKMTKAGNVLPFNAAAIVAAKPRDNKRTEYRIEGVPGLALVVHPTGDGVWYAAYPDGKGGKKRLHLGHRNKGKVQIVSLHDAKTKLQETQIAIASGSDPVKDKQDGKAARDNAMTVRQMCEMRFEQDDSLRPQSRRVYQDVLNRDVYTTIGDEPAGEITAGRIVGILDRIEKRAREAGHSGKRTADHTRIALSACYRWAIARQLLSINPCSGHEKRDASNARNRVLNSDDLRALWNGLNSDAAPVSFPMRRILLLALLTGQRRGEVCGIKKREVTLEGHVMTTDGRRVEAPVWIIPGDTKKRGKVQQGRTKNGLEQVVPMGPMAAAIFKQAMQDAGSGEYLFPTDAEHLPLGKAAPDCPHIHKDSVSKSMRRVRAKFNVEDVTVHDLRRAIATGLGEAGVRPDVIDKVLNHAPVGVTRRHYDFSKLLPEVRAAFELWEGIVGKPDPAPAIEGGNVVSLKPRAA